ncbi:MULTISPECIES: FkbM family methyltransferase [Polynucleobacter]|nr:MULTISPECIES: FkbM family methyltransferase [Polynucleobacter]MBU3553730.1 FkbM family methyltransferase [Polynucleobacter sp. MWH-Post4-6-1]
MTLLSNELSILAPVITKDLERIGNKGDGGYVLPLSSVKDADFLISMGVNTDWSFDEHFLEINPNIFIHAYDHTISERQFRKNIKKPLFRLLYGKSSIKEVLSYYSLYRSYKNFFRDKVTHFQERIHNRIDHPYDATLDLVMERAKASSIVLKVDIEGSEYRVIDEILRYSAIISALVIEFHHTEPYRNLFLDSISKLKKEYDIVHIHGNNYDFVATDGLPEVLEITFVKSAKNSGFEKRKNFPIDGLDYPNNPEKDDFKFSFS